MRGRLLIIVAILLILVVVAGLFITGNLPIGQQSQPVDGNTPPINIGNNNQPVPTPTEIPSVELVIAVQELPRGFRIPREALALRNWPLESAPFNAVYDIEQVVNKIARSDIFREQPILSNMLVDDFTNLANQLGRVGSDAAAILPSNLVAIAMPVDRLTSVAYAIQPGDRVDVIVSMLFVDVDEAFQSISPNEITLFTITEDGIEFTETIQGRPDVISLGNAIISPSERQRPRLLTQRTIQDALVVYTGDFPFDGRILGPPPTPTPIPEDAEQTDGEPAPAPVLVRPDIVTLGVTPQDAVLMVWAIESKLPLTLALRSATDTSRVPTEPVTLDVFMQEYRITVPGKREYTIEPAITSIRQLDLFSDQVTLGGG